MSQIRHLRALQAFNTAATFQNLSHAAGALSVTQGAVSRQIKQLEEHLGVTLFRRTSNGVVKTETGERLHIVTQQAFGVLELGLGEIRQPPNKRSLTISMASALAIKWLVPRLPMFRSQHPRLEIFLDTSDNIVDLSDSDVDVALRFTKPQSDDLFREVIVAEALIVVASPRLVEGIARPMPAEDICRLPILSDNFDPQWPKWAEAAGQQMADSSLKPGIRFKDSAVMLSAAIDGQGVALARKLLVADDLAAGRLVQLDETEIPLERSLSFVCRQRDKDHPNLRKLRNWLHTL